MPWTTNQPFHSASHMRRRHHTTNVRDNRFVYKPFHFLRNLLLTISPNHKKGSIGMIENASLGLSEVRSCFRAFHADLIHKPFDSFSCTYLYLSLYLDMLIGCCFIQFYFMQSSLINNVYYNYDENIVECMIFFFEFVKIRSMYSTRKEDSF